MPAQTELTHTSGTDSTSFAARRFSMSPRALMRSVCAAVIKVAKGAEAINGAHYSLGPGHCRRETVFQRQRWLMRLPVPVPQGIPRCCQLPRGTRSHSLWDWAWQDRWSPWAGKAFDSPKRQESVRKGAQGEVSANGMA